MKSWTTPAQLAWLKERVPDWFRARRKKGGTTPFLSDTVAQFIVEFKLGKSERIKSPSVSALIPSPSAPLRFPSAPPPLPPVRITTDLVTEN